MNAGYARGLLFIVFFMADPAITGNEVDDTKKTSKFRGFGLPEIKIGKVFSNGIEITQIKIDGQDSRNQKNLTVRASSKVIIFGRNLNLFSAVALRHGYEEAKTPEKNEFWK